MSRRKERNFFSLREERSICAKKAVCKVDQSEKKGGNLPPSISREKGRGRSCCSRKCLEEESAQS